MLDIQPSPDLPRFAFGEYDAVIMEGISYRTIDCTGDGYVFARTDGTGVAESFSHAVLSQRVTLGALEHRRDAFLPEGAAAAAGTGPGAFHPVAETTAKSQVP